MNAVVGVLVSLGLLTTGPIGGFRSEGIVEREVSYRENLVCIGSWDGATASDVLCVAALPESTPRQDVTIDWISPGSRAIRDDFGNLLLTVERSALKAGETLDVGWRARVRLRAGIHHVDASRLPSLLAIPEDVIVRYMRDGEAYRLDDPVLAAVAESARDAATDPLDLAFKLNEIVREHLSYERDAAWDAAPKVWRRRTGSCSEYHFVFASLCRNAGLPVRYVGASALRSGDDDYIDTVFHRWSEVYLPGYGWYPIDVSRNDCEDGSPVNDSFGSTPVNLLELMRGDGGDDNMLGWSYVANVRVGGDDGASVLARRRIQWSQPPREPLPALSLATLLGR
jgi:transglutaminase-like putative cysteine protease